ncbi:hypothetical protein [Enterovibrio paralichthyis]|uniref:hypothetical protein n=1 Tax=Enterovibrio paralichthyis TaxID=2853805 RepID=UPI001C4554BD|nr:hypothetical protein [Enterovibrio paralichthyis]MBV7300235.1 hypothetical protein [Enterovibrio paralichthyis]
MLKSTNCSYADSYIEMYNGGIAIDLENKAVFVDYQGENHMFDAFQNGSIEVAILRKPQGMNVNDGKTFVVGALQSSTLEIRQGNNVYRKNLDDVALEPFLKGVELAGFEWSVEPDLSQRSIVISA